MRVQVVYSEFLDLVRTGNVKQARIDESLQRVYFSVQPRLDTQQDPTAVASASGKSQLARYDVPYIALVLGGIP